MSRRDWAVVVWAEAIVTAGLFLLWWFDVGGGGR